MSMCERQRAIRKVSMAERPFLATIAPKIAALPPLVQRRHPQEIVEAACAACQVNPHEVIGNRGRSPQVVACREIVILLCRRLTLLSYPAITQVLGWTSHSSTIEAYQRTQEGGWSERWTNMHPSSRTRGELLTLAEDRLGVGRESEVL